MVTLVAVAGASKVHCPGFSEGVCNCADDCSANANLCACAEARHCCDASSTTPWDGAVWEASVSMAAGETGRPIGAAFSDAAGATKLVVAKNKKVDVYTGAADASAATVERTYALDFLCETPSHFPVTLSGVEDRDVLMTLAGTGPLCDCVWSEDNWSCSTLYHYEEFVHFLEATKRVLWGGGCCRSERCGLFSAASADSRS